MLAIILTEKEKQTIRLIRATLKDQAEDLTALLRGEYEGNTELLERIHDTIDALCNDDLTAIGCRLLDSTESEGMPK